jgi:hypothetical protein
VAGIRRQQPRQHAPAATSIQNSNHPACKRHMTSSHGCRQRRRRSRPHH